MGLSLIVPNPIEKYCLEHPRLVDEMSLLLNQVPNEHESLKNDVGAAPKNNLVGGMHVDYGVPDNVNQN